MLTWLLARMKRRREGDVSPTPASKLTRLSKTPQRDREETSDEHSTSSEHQQQGSSPAVIYLVEKKIPSGQLSHLKTVARRKSFSLSTSLDDSVTHVVSALPSYERTEAVLKT